MKIQSSNSLSKIGLLSHIASFLHNEISQRLGSDGEYLDAIVKEIEAIKNLETPFANEVKDNNWNRKRKTIAFIIRWKGE